MTPPCFAVGALRIGGTYGMPTEPLVKHFLTSVNLKHRTCTLKEVRTENKHISRKEKKGHFTIIQLEHTLSMQTVASTKLNTSPHLECVVTYPYITHMPTSVTYVQTQQIKTLLT